MERSMEIAERTEEALKKLHLLFANAQIGAPDGTVLIDKQEAVALLRELGDCMNQMLSQSELTKESRERGVLEQKRSQETIIYNARRSAQDIYAASLMYTDQALTQIQRIIEEAEDQMEGVILDMQDRMEYEKEVVHGNQFDLRAQLQDLRDTDKYMRLIEEENIRIERERASGEFTGEADQNPYQDIKPEIHINAAYFQATGQEIPLDEGSGEEKNKIVYDGIEGMTSGSRDPEGAKNEDAWGVSSRETGRGKAKARPPKDIEKDISEETGGQPEEGNALQSTDYDLPVATKKADDLSALMSYYSKEVNSSALKKYSAKNSKKGTKPEEKSATEGIEGQKEELDSPGFTGKPEAERYQITEEELAMMDGKTGRDYDPSAAKDPLKAAALMEDLDADYFAWKEEQAAKNK